MQTKINKKKVNKSIIYILGFRIKFFFLRKQDDKKSQKSSNGLSRMSKVSVR